MTDKNIVYRTRTHRNSDVARAVRHTRDRLSQHAGKPAFDRELLKLHARAMINTALAVPFLVMIVAVVGALIGVGMNMVVWALVTVVCHSALALISSWVSRTPQDKIKTAKARRIFLLGHFLSGLGWAYFAWLDCISCQVQEFAVLKAVMLLLVIAAIAIISSALNGALVITFALPVFIFALSVSLSPDWLPVEMIMAGLLIVSLPFFSYVARNLHSSTVMLLSFRVEKDSLIAELETAKAISDEARRRAEANLATKSRFLAMMSHELRTPLNAILGFSEVMSNQVLGPLENETYRNYAKDINSSGLHLLHLINEILDLSRIEAGRYQLNEEPLLIETVVKECCHLMELKAHKKNLRVVQQFEPRLPQLLADERSMRQIILNLLSNAIKFAPNGSEVRVRVGWTAGGGQYVSIKDNGPGIPENEIPVVMSVFGQGSIAIKNAEQGTGLGLPIVQGLVALYGGEFQLHSGLRKGTEAIVAFPSFRVIMDDLPIMRKKQKMAAAE